MWIDSHCHLTHERIHDLGTPEDIVALAQAAGVEGMLNICCRVSNEFPLVLETARKFDNVWCTIGTHPHDAALEGEIAISQERLLELARSDPKIVGIGETGLDYFYDNAPREAQQVSFAKHMRAAMAGDFPLIVHTRDADEDTMRMMREAQDKAPQGQVLRGVLHCFSSGRNLAQEALDFGFYISLSGILTFKQAQELRDIVKDIPLDRILVETDAPFLAPIPHRGKTNQPAYVVHTGAVLAEIKDLPEEDIAQATTANFFRLFNKIKNP